MELIQEPAVADPEELKHPLAIQLEKELIDKLAGTQVNISTINTALDLIKRYHGGVKRKSGEPFFTHPISVALILLEYSQDQDAILGALLHDTIEDTNLTLAQIRKLFGETVEFLVAKATNLEGYKNRASLPDYENIVRIMNYEDPRAALVKLSDRLHNMRTIQHHPQLSKQKSIAKETLDYFVPLARQLHLHPMAEELERLSQEVIAKKE
jgi:(p)ppGpp synthase/HD superfamily hydrolase